jgi:autotransporter-associated beta strand protein
MKRTFLPAATFASLALIPCASADVIYSGQLDTTIPTTFDGVDITINGSTLNLFFGGVGIANEAGLQPFRDGTGGLDTILGFADDIVISGSSGFLATGAGGSQDHLDGINFTAGQERYIGFQLNGTDYGWARVVLTNNTAGAVVRDWAYNTGGGPIATGNIKQDGSTFTLDSVAGSFTLGSAITGSNSVVVNGANTVTLSTSNTYTGSTLISAAGTLSIDGSGSINNSAVTIDGGTFRYNSSVAYTNTLNFNSGTIGGSNLTGTLGGLEIGAGQTLSPGNSTGTALTTSQTWAGGGTYRFEINDAAGIAGAASGWDLLSGSGSLGITADSGSPFTIAVITLGLNQVEGEAVNFNNLSSYSWLLADFGSPVNNFAATAFQIDTTQFANVFTGAFGLSRGDSILGGDDSQIYLTYTPVPEPRGVLLTVLGTLALLRRRRRA